MQTEKAQQTDNLRGLNISLGGLTVGTCLSILFVVIVTMAAEQSAGLKNFLTELTGHHWVSKGLISLGIFILGTLIANPIVKKWKVDATFWSILASGLALLGVVVLFFFFVGHFVAP